MGVLLKGSTVGEVQWQAPIASFYCQLSLPTSRHTFFDWSTHVHAMDDKQDTLTPEDKLQESLKGRSSTVSYMVTTKPNSRAAADGFVPDDFTE